MPVYVYVFDYPVLCSRSASPSERGVRLQYSTQRNASLTDTVYVILLHPLPVKAHPAPFHVTLTVWCQDRSGDIHTLELCSVGHPAKLRRSRVLTRLPASIYIPTTYGGGSIVRSAPSRLIPLLERIPHQGGSEVGASRRRLRGGVGVEVEGGAVFALGALVEFDRRRHV